jgi:hypothetical protein
LNICRGRQEIIHAELEKALMLNPSEVEDFLIEGLFYIDLHVSFVCFKNFSWINLALKTRLISGKIDAAQRRFRITTCIEPSFSKAKWQELREGLGNWQSQVI